MYQGSTLLSYILFPYWFGYQYIVKDVDLLQLCTSYSYENTVKTFIEGCCTFVFRPTYTQ